MVWRPCPDLRGGVRSNAHSYRNRGGRRKTGDPTATAVFAPVTNRWPRIRFVAPGPAPGPIPSRFSLTERSEGGPRPKAGMTVVPRFATEHGRFSL